MLLSDLHKGRFPFFGSLDLAQVGVPVPAKFLVGTSDGLIFSNGN